MDCGACEPTVQAVQQHFAFLFSQFGFRLLHCEAAGQGEHCLIVLESEQARIKFEVEQGTPVVYFGTLDSPVGWAIQVDGVQVWYALNSLLNFAERKQVEVAPKSSGEPEATADDLLAQEAARLQPHAAELVAAFAPNRPAGWWREYEAYRAAVIRQIQQRFKSR